MAQPEQNQQKKPFSSFRLLSFDIYGTLIDWETGIFDALTPLRSRLPEGHPLKSDAMALGAMFNAHEIRIQAEQPGLRYNAVLREAYVALAREVGALPSPAAGGDSDAGGDVDSTLSVEGTAFAASITHWPAFPDTVPATRKLKRLGFKLVPLSNVDRASFAKTLSGPLAGLTQPDEEEEAASGPASASGLGVDPCFDAIYTAQDIGSYKPDVRNFDYLIEHVARDFGVAKHEILHVAQSLFHDHEPAKKVGLASVWIARGEKDGESAMGGKVEEFLGSEGKVTFGWKFRSLGEFADAVEREMLEEERKKFAA
ncbi:hypothetical protein VTN77DRAFT_9102 [Rasamsonia byssochlamydoides]|uniref:uncharacterized protein n=1 Tax=Rasamsonia byssochlamydoides TaxID=89139 RepID=UPI0037443D4A